MLNSHIQRAITSADAAAASPQSPPATTTLDDADLALAPLTPALEALKALIESEPRVYMLFTQMFDEVPRGLPHLDWPVATEVRGWRRLLAVLQQVVTTAPRWDNGAMTIGLVGVPMAVLLEYVTGTPSGYAAFLCPDVAKCFKDILTEWGKFLQTSASTSELVPGKHGWLGKDALHHLERVGNGPYDTDWRFDQLYECSSTQEHYGFQSWDDFFTRRFRAGMRPIASPSDRSVIANPCESVPYHIAHNAKLRDNFFAKGEPYSILDMLAHDPLATTFANGTVYQAFLSPLSYHRWHAPVSGTVQRAFVQEGSYFSQPVMFHDHRPGNPPSPAKFASRRRLHTQSQQDAQGYLTALATRGIIIISAEDPRIGLVAFIAIGMDEVSTCDITVAQGQRITKGQELGMFHFGGSSFCLVFQPGAVLAELPALGGAVNVPVNGRLAVVQDL